MEIETTTAANGTQGDNFKSSVLSSVDIIVIVLYFIVTLAVGLWASRSSSRRSVKGYFLAGRSMSWLPVGASLFASNIGTGHFIGLAGTGAANGIAIGSFEWIAPYLILLLGWVFLPVYVSCGVYTMPEYLRKRYGGQRLRIAMSVISMMLYVLTKIAVDIYAGALFIQLALGINMYLAIVSLLVVASVYTILGGLKAVIYTDTMQTVVMLIGGVLVMAMSFAKIGGYNVLEERYMNAIPKTTIDSWGTSNSTTCGVPRADSFHIFRDAVDSDLPWPGMLSGIFLLGTWYWCTDQVIVQRALASNSIQHAKGGCVLAGFLKLIPMYIIVMTGMVSRVLFPDEVACVEPSECERVCQNPEGCSNIAYPKLVLEVLPTGLRGIMVAAMLSALMSSLTSIFSSTSTIFTLDIWTRIRKTATEKEQLIVGKITVVLLVAISILWIPILLTSAGGQLFIYLQGIQSALGPPIFAIYFYGILFPRINEKGAFWGLIVGFSGGIIRLILDFSHKAPPCGDDEYRPAILFKINYLYVSSIVFAASTIVIFTVSYLTAPPKEKELYGTTWKTIHKRMAESHGRKPSLEERVVVEPSENVEPESNEMVEKKEEDINNDYRAETDQSKPSEYHLSDLYEDEGYAFWLNAIAISLIIITTFLMGYYG
ncbi:sodium/mannose cotransporter SLC5A10-like [Styela clava]